MKKCITVICLIIIVSNVMWIFSGCRCSSGMLSVVNKSTSKTVINYLEDSDVDAIYDMFSEEEKKTDHYLYDTIKSLVYFWELEELSVPENIEVHDGGCLKSIEEGVTVYDYEGYKVINIESKRNIAYDLLIYETCVNEEKPSEVGLSGLAIQYVNCEVISTYTDSIIDTNIGDISVYDNRIEVINEIENIKNSNGFYDLNEEARAELVINKLNKLGSVGTDSFPYPLLKTESIELCESGLKIIHTGIKFEFLDGGLYRVIIHKDE